MIQFDFDDRHGADQPADRQLPWIGRVLIAYFAFNGFVTLIILPWLIILLLVWPARAPQTIVRQRPEPPSEPFVFVESMPQLPKPPLRARPDLSDVDRRAQSPERAPVPDNPAPRSRGNTPERIDTPAAAPARGVEAPPEPPQPQPQPQEQVARNTLPGPIAPQVETPPRRPPGSIIGEAVRNIGKYAKNQTFNNPQGGATDPGAAIQFDTKGVEFGPWIRRFVSQVRRNWFVPLSAMSFHGHVVLQFNIHRDGRITDVTVKEPSDIDSFNRAAYNAILESNPTEPLPAEYPDEKAFFTVTFYYNEQPGS